MFVQVDDSLQLGLDCFAVLSARRGIAWGWAMTPRDVGTELAISAGADGECVIEHVAFHARPDVVPADPRQAVVNGFVLVFALPPAEAHSLDLVVNAGTQQLRVDLLAPAIGANLFKVTVERDWSTSFGLLQDCARHAALAELLHYQGRPFGAFAEWLTRLPLVEGRAERFGQLAEVEALATPAGEALILLRGAAGMPLDASAALAVIGQVAPFPGQPPVAASLPLLDLHSLVLPGVLAIYARLDPALLDRLHGFEAVVNAALLPGQEVWLRARPRLVATPEFLDAAARAAPGRALDLLRQVVARREAAFLPMLAAPPGAAPAATARTVLLVGADDPVAARLFHVQAAAFEGRCDRLLVLGEAAEAVAEVFRRRDRIDVAAGAEALEALRDAAEGGVIALDAARFAASVIAGDVAAAFDQRLDGAALARLLRLHALGGCALPLADSLERLLRRQSSGAPHAAPGFAPVMRPWSSHLAAGHINAHLARLWSAAAPQDAAHV